MSGENETKGGEKRDSKYQYRYNAGATCKYMQETNSRFEQPNKNLRSFLGF